MSNEPLADLLAFIADIALSTNQDQTHQPDGQQLAITDVYRILGSLATFADAIPHALERLASTLQRSPAALNDHTVAHPAYRAAVTAGALTEASDAFAVAAQRLNDARAPLRVSVL